MRIEPKLYEVVNGARGVLRGIDVALEAECLVSGVALMFAALDSLAALARPVGQAGTTRADFVNWSEKYLQPSKSLGCTSLDLYAARCGVLHTYSAESDLERAGKARRLIYEWRTGPKADAVFPLPDGATVIEVEALRDAIREATGRFMVDTETDVATRERVQQHLPSLLCYAPWPRLQVDIAA
jgi:hypothetical protein